MKISKELENKIINFSKEQSIKYVEDLKNENLKKNDSYSCNKNTIKEAQNDMIIYMSDYISDLMSKGLTESEAFLLAKEKLINEDKENIQNNLNDKVKEYYENFDSKTHEVIGTIYGGFILFFLVVGALIGYFISYDINSFTKIGWIYTLVGGIVGILIGTSFGLIIQGIIISKRNK